MKTFGVHRLWVWLIISILLAGCSNIGKKSQSEKHVRVYEHNYDVVYAAVGSVLDSKGYPIAKEDEDLGLYESEWMEGKNNRVKLEAEVKPLARKRTLVQIAIKREERGSEKKPWKPSPVLLAVYEDIFEDLDMQVYREYFLKIERKALDQE